MTTTLSRRSILKATGATVGALAASRIGSALASNHEPIDFWNAETVSFNELYNNPPMLGRVEANRLRITKGPYITDGSVRNIYLFYILPIYGAIRGDAPYPYLQNDVWYITDEGYVHSSYVVPVKEEYNQPETAVDELFWGEITVPLSWLHVKPSLESRRYDFRTAYGATFQVVERADDAEGRAWYRLVDDYEESQPWWIQASHVRRISREEFAPINPHIEDKRIEISLSKQLLTAYENSIPIFNTRIASGTAFQDDEGNDYDFSTSIGEWTVQRKRPARHMVGGEAIDDYYNLPGVPWDTYFTFTGAAIHGTFWHNDYGRPRSHGCINVSADAAKWVYRWSQPYMSYDDIYRWTERGELATPIIVT